MGDDLYRLRVRTANRAGALSVVARLTHEPDGRLIWARRFDVPPRLNANSGAGEEP